MHAPGRDSHALDDLLATLHCRPLDMSMTKFDHAPPRMRAKQAWVAAGAEGPGPDAMPSDTSHRLHGPR
ncbi:hypothetical protein CNR27_11070 [Luteimonas chenhongjianii]|uniref:Uncharacterized protein n=1 Tax=Luteimonas chenhongjianii TaxID=2006110 RepID=A0A290XFG4_9GAMM|nr:hypothetical protein CNR27_11070 [Luteimonas chenhongjianii]RPD88432.1 hypothetical protein EGK76_04570 [Luteimonas sp. 100069]